MCGRTCSSWSQARYPLNAAVYRSILTAANGSEDCVISLVQARIPGNVRNWLNKHYRNHPNVRKYL